MTLRPELTFRSALAAMIRWSWLIAIVVVASALAARAVAQSRSKPSYTASVTIHEVDTSVGLSGSGDLVPVTLDRKSPPSASQFLVSEVARVAARNLPGMTASKLLGGISVKAIDLYDEQFSYTARSRSEVTTALARYVTAYVAFQRSSQVDLLRKRLAALPPTRYFPNGVPIGGADLRPKFRAAIAAVPVQIATQGDLRVASSGSSVSRLLATLAGGLAGLAIGVLLALAITRFDPRVRRRSNLALPGADLFEATPSGLAALRVDLELTAIGENGAVISVSPVSGRHARGAALELARAFSSTGAAVVLVGVATGSSDRGVRSFLDGSDPTLHVTDLEPNLKEVAAGESAIDDALLFSAGSVHHLLDEARRSASVVIVHTDALHDHPESLLVVGAADGAVVLVRPETRWGSLEDSVDQIVRIARTRVRIWFEKEPRASAPRHWVPQRTARDDDSAIVEVGS